MQPFANLKRLYTIVSAHLSRNRPAVDIYCSTTVPMVMWPAGEPGK